MFRVRWATIAEDELADSWLKADSPLRKAITSGVHQLDLLLQREADVVGESRPEGRRVLFLSPLGVNYRIEADGVTVSILRAWVFRKRK